MMENGFEGRYAYRGGRRGWGGGFGPRWRGGWGGGGGWGWRRPYMGGRGWGFFPGFGGGCCCALPLLVIVAILGAAGIVTGKVLLNGTPSDTEKDDTNR